MKNVWSGNQDARFGMFIHWGLYSIPARGEWVRSVEEIPEEEYLPFMKEFDARDYNPKQWAKEAKAAGMKYVVLTAKHHDGFCLFDSKYTDYKVTNTPAGRDLIKEYVEALREEGLKVGIYFTLLDWHHPDYPHYGDRIHPMRNHKECGNENRDFSRYTEYLYNQVEEICTNYGQIDIIWFDFSYDDMRGEKWGATKLINMVRSLQPQVIIDNRLEASGEGRGSLYECDPTPYHGDFVSPEQIIPPEGICDKEGNPMVWEACFTMNNNWGYCANDHYYKPASMLIKKLVECVSKGGNLILNVGPDAKGNIPDASQKILSEIGTWMKKTKQHLRLRQGRYSKTGQRPSDPQRQQAVLSSLREHDWTDATYRYQERSGEIHPLSGNRSRGAHLHQLGTYGLSGHRFC